MKQNIFNTILMSSSWCITQQKMHTERHLVITSNQHSTQQTYMSYCLMNTRNNQTTPTIQLSEKKCKIKHHLPKNTLGYRKPLSNSDHPVKSRLIQMLQPQGKKSRFCQNQCRCASKKLHRSTTRHFYLCRVQECNVNQT